MARGFLELFFHLFNRTGRKLFSMTLGGKNTKSSDILTEARCLICWSLVLNLEISRKVKAVMTPNVFL